MEITHAFEFHWSETKVHWSSLELNPIHSPIFSDAFPLLTHGVSYHASVRSPFLSCALLSTPSRALYQVSCLQPDLQWSLLLSTAGLPSSNPFWSAAYSHGHWSFTTPESPSESYYGCGGRLRNFIGKIGLCRVAWSMNM